MRNHWDANIRLGWLLGLVFVAGLLGATVAAVVLVIIKPVTIWTFVLSVGALLALLLALRLIYQLWGLIHAAYEMDRNVMIIHWGAVHCQIPMASVRDVFSGADVQHLRMHVTLRWPGYYVGLGEDEVIGPILFYATRPLAEQVIMRTDSLAYAISPNDLEEFLPAFKERLAMGPTQEVEEFSTHPAFLDWAIWHDRYAMITLIGSVLWLILLTGMLCWRYPYLPAEIALRFAPTGEPLLLAETSRIFYMALIGAIIWVLNGALGLLLYRRVKIAAYFLWSGLLAVQSWLWVAVVTVLLRQ